MRIEITSGYHQQHEEPERMFEMLRRVEELFDDAVRIFGGATLLDAAGIWMDKETGATEREPVVIYRITTDDVALARAFAEKVRTRLDQKCVLFETETIHSEYV